MEQKTKEYLPEVKNEKAVKAGNQMKGDQNKSSLGRTLRSTYRIDNDDDLPKLFDFQDYKINKYDEEQVNVKRFVHYMQTPAGKMNRMQIKVAEQK